MDERTLNDLLECSVCLERLDTSSKVLPCQHTFCRKCLEVIVTSKQELRCPECRILVDSKIDELPPNVLLMRILEGMKNSTQNHSCTKLQRTTNSTTKCGDAVFSDNELTECSNFLKEQNCTNKKTIPHAFALYDFVSKETGDLNFKKGDIILLKKKIDINWFIGEIDHREGAFPINYVQIIVPLPVPQCIALYDFKMGPNEEEGCLSFKKGAMIHILRRVDHNWAEGRIGSCIGIFPIAFVEMNSIAKQLLEISEVIVPRCLPPVPYENIVTDSSSTVTTSPNSTCSSNTSSNSVPSSPISNLNSTKNDTSVKHQELKEKRHSLNGLTANNSLSIVQTHRHSAEIYNVLDNNESTDSLPISCANPPQIMSPPPSRNNDEKQTHRQLQNQYRQNTRPNVLKTSNISIITPNLPWAYLALYPYKPRKSDELELKKGCVYFVTERCLDGWYKGKNWAEKSGVFPGNYVTPLRNKDQQQLIHHKSIFYTPLPQQVTTQPQHLAQNHNEYINSSIQTIPPPELPPRRNTTSNSVWTKPLGHHVEAFFNRKSSANQQKNDKPTSTNQIIPNFSISSKETTHSQEVLKEKDKKDSNSSSAVSLMKRLTNMKRSKSPPTHSYPNTYSIDNPVFESTMTSPATSAKHNVSLSHPVHVRSGSCPSQILQSLPININGASTSGADPNTVYSSQRMKGHKERPSLSGIRGTRNVSNSNGAITSSLMTKSTPINNNKVQSSQICSGGSNHNIHHHRKSQSLDANTISSQMISNPIHSKSIGRERFRCVMSYPPNSEQELELNVGDIVIVHRKQKNGWYKGTLIQTNKTGLFPASFVEPDI